MKQFLLNFKIAITTVLLALPMLATGQDQTGADLKFMYGYDANSINESPKLGDIRPIDLYPLSDEIIVRRKADVTKDGLESLIKRHLPDAQFTWLNSYIYPDTILGEGCVITTESDGLDDIIESLLLEDDLTYVGKVYIRKSYKDWMDIYPVKKVATYCIYGDIALSYLNKWETIDEVDSLIESFGLEQWGQWDNGFTITVQKGVDIFSVANQLYETGLFYLASPSKRIVNKTLNAQPIDKTNLPFCYGSSGNKAYWYNVDDRLTVIKTSATDQSEMESIIRKHVEESEILWNNDNTCTVVMDPANVDAALAALLQEESVSHVSRMYFNIGSYEGTLSRGLKDPECYGLNGKIDLSFKESTSADEKSNLIKDYNLKVLYRDEEDDPYYSSYEVEVPKTADPLSVSNSIFETGLVSYSQPCTTAEAKVSFYWSGGTTAVKTVANEAQETAVQYYDLLGHKVATPSGLTIVVKRYSDGTVRTEKILFR